MSNQLDHAFPKESANNSEDGSETDVEASLLGGHNVRALRYRNSPHSKLKQSWKIVSGICKVVFYISASTSCCLWIYISLMNRNIKLEGQEVTVNKDKVLFTGFGSGDYGLAEDISGQIPTFGKEMWMFWNNSKFILDDPLHATLEEEHALTTAWKSIVPEGNGFVTLDNSISPILPPPINQPEDLEIDRFCLTVWHQIHCLRGIQESYYNLIKNPSVVDMRSLGHVNHCIDYLRESLMCYGDTALEGQSTYSSEERANGNAANHVCKDFKSLLDWSNSRSSKRLAQSMRLAGKTSKGGGH